MSIGIEWGVAARAIDGEDESGDQYLVKSFTDGILVAVVDGLGHGPKASTASKAAVASMENRVHEPVSRLLEHCHQSIRGTRGAVVSLASFSLPESRLTWLGVGNVRGLLVRADQKVERPREWLLLRGGVVGYQLPTLRPAILDVSPGDTLIFTTDGVRSGFADSLDVNMQSPQEIADHIFREHRRGTDDTLVLVARYTG